MAIKNVISSILATFLSPKKGTPTVCRNADVSGTDTRRNKCAVCLSSLTDREEGCTRVLPCRHEFHVVCVDRWLAVRCYKSTCPVCRFSMDENRGGGGGGDGGESRRSECFFTEEMIIWFSSFHVAGF